MKCAAAEERYKNVDPGLYLLWCILGSLCCCQPVTMPADSHLRPAGSIESREFTEAIDSQTREVPRGGSGPASIVVLTSALVGRWV